MPQHVEDVSGNLLTSCLGLALGNQVGITLLGNAKLLLDLAVCVFGFFDVLLRLKEISFALFDIRLTIHSALYCLVYFLVIRPNLSLATCICFPKGG